MGASGAAGAPKSEGVAGGAPKRDVAGCEGAGAPNENELSRLASAVVLRGGQVGTYDVLANAIVSLRICCNLELMVGTKEVRIRLLSPSLLLSLESTTAKQHSSSMPRLSTQPAKAVQHLPVVPLRSGFFALPFALPGAATVYLVARVHHGGAEDEGDEGRSAAGTTQLFVTPLPLQTTEDEVKNAFERVYSKEVSHVRLLPATVEQPTMYDIASSSTSTVLPLFPSSHGSSTLQSSCSAVVTFSSPTPLPPLASTSMSWPQETPASYLAATQARHDLARPHLSTVIAHSDSWMNAFDAKKIAAAAAQALVPVTASSKAAAKVKAAKAKNGKGKKGANLPPAPGSAAAALAAHSAAVALAADRTRNVDAVEEEEWTMVSRGGKHGQSLLPAGAVPSLVGYGAVTVGVARKKAPGAPVVESGGEGEHSVIVGEGFYRFKKEEGRRAGGYHIIDVLSTRADASGCLRSHGAQGSVRDGQGSSDCVPRKVWRRPRLVARWTRRESGVEPWAGEFWSRRRRRRDERRAVVQAVLDANWKLGQHYHRS